MAGKMEPLPGTSDVWAPETAEWVKLENAAREVFSRYGYGELRTPIFERTAVFVRSIGDQTEVVQKEMYTFEDRGGRSLTLRPEGTAGVMRAIVNQGLAEGVEKRVFYMGPMFRGERPAAGRKRQFHQIGGEAVGRCSPVLDAECMAMLMHYLERIGVGQTRLLLNTRGTAEDRPAVCAGLADHFRPRIAEMCEDCQRRLETNVWRILDCKNEACRHGAATAPEIPGLLGETSRSFFAAVCRALDRLGVAYEADPKLVRGLDYYEHTVFEVVCDGENLGAQNAVAGGGRYRIELPGVKNAVPGVGFAAGVERLLLARGVLPGGEAMGLGEVDVYVAGLGEAGTVAGLELAQRLRRADWRVLAETEGRSLKAQLRTADKSGAGYVFILGEQELATGTVACKCLADSRQQVWKAEEAVECFRKWTKDI
jgi:histidyl-tRNA synthetase